MNEIRKTLEEREKLYDTPLVKELERYAQEALNNDDYDRCAILQRAIKEITGRTRTEITAWQDQRFMDLMRRAYYWDSLAEAIISDEIIGDAWANFITLLKLAAPNAIPGLTVKDDFLTDKYYKGF